MPVASNCHIWVTSNKECCQIEHQSNEMMSLFPPNKISWIEDWINKLGTLNLKGQSVMLCAGSEDYLYSALIWLGKSYGQEILKQSSYSLLIGIHLKGIFC